MAKRQSVIHLFSFNKIKKFYQQKLFQGKSRFVDRTLFRLFGTVNEVLKKLSPQFIKKWSYQQLLNYILQPLPYDSSLPLLGSKAEIKAFLEFRKKRFLEIAKPCDVILVKSDLRLGRIIQTLTHSPYSHATFYRGNGEIVEADPDGILVEQIDKYMHLDIRICRPVMLTTKGETIVSNHIDEMIRKQPQYDVTNIEKLLFKYIYVRFRPDLKVYIGGSSRFEKYYICSGLIAHGFHKAGYPIVPLLKFRRKKENEQLKLEAVSDYFQWVRHSKKNYSQIVPGDFDNSSFFASVKFLCIESNPKSRKRTFK